MIPIYDTRAASAVRQTIDVDGSRVVVAARPAGHVAHALRDNLVLQHVALAGPFLAVAIDALALARTSSSSTWTVIGSARYGAILGVHLEVSARAGAVRLALRDGEALWDVPVMLEGPALVGLADALAIATGRRAAA